jgi:hypothetical protein
MPPNKGRLESMIVHQRVSIVILLVAFFTTSGWAADGVISESHAAGNLSGIETTPPGRTAPEPGISACRGLSRYRAGLNDILTDADLVKEVSCIVADFDSNGSLDFVIWGRHEPSQRGLRGTRSFKALFFDGQRLIRTETIRREDYDQAVLWARGRGFDGACKVSPPTVDGIMLPGEGGGTWHYLYERKSERLKAGFACDE